MVSTAAFHARVRGSFPGFGSLKETQMFHPHPRVKLSIVGSLRDREVACSASDRQGSIFESCVWRTVSSHSSHHPQEVLLAQFSLYVHKGSLKADSFHFCLSVEGIAFKLVVTGIDLPSIAQLAIKYKYLISAKTQLFEHTLPSHIVDSRPCRSFIVHPCTSQSQHSKLMLNGMVSDYYKMTV